MTCYMYTLHWLCPFKGFDGSEYVFVIAIVVLTIECYCNVLITLEHDTIKTTLQEVTIST